MAITDDFPTGHASLSDGTTKIPFIFTDGQGKKNQRSFKADPSQRTALKTTTGESKYSDLQEPYFAIPQDDFTGGRGNEDFENDTSRYFDGLRIDTSKEGGAVLGGRETYSTGYRNADFVMPGSMLFTAMFTTEAYDEYYATTFEASASYTTYQCEVFLKRTGTPASIKVELWSDSGGTEPNAMLCTKTLTPAQVTSDTLGVSVLRAFIWTGEGSNETIADGTHYWVVVVADGSDNSTNYWQLGMQSGVTGKRSIDDGSTWSNQGSGAPYFRITPVAINFVGKSFEYKSCFYMVTQPEAGGNSALYINGDRGAADVNGDKSTLVDGTKSAVWIADEWIGAKVSITKGPGSDEEQSWRTITDSSTTTLTVSPDWNVTHSIATEYVILGSDKWTALDADLGAFVTDVVVAGEFIWLAKGGADGDDGIHRYRFYNKSGTWTAEEEATSNSLISDKLLVVNHTDEGEILYSSTTDHDLNDISIYKAKVPRGAISVQEWLFYPQYEFETGVPWKAIDVTNVTSSVDAAGYTKMVIDGAHTTGTAAAFNLAAPLDIRNGQSLVAEVKTEAALASGDYKWLYDDVEDLGKTWSPVKVLKEDYSTTWSPDKVLLANYNYDDQPLKVCLMDEMGASPTYTDLPEVYDGMNNNHESITVETDDRILIGYDKPFDSVYFDMGTVNANAVNIAVYYWDGGDITAVANISDGTETGSDTPLGQDGTISWDMPADTKWRTQIINSVEAYWIQIGFSGALTAPITIKRIVVFMNDATTMTPEFYDLTNIYNGDSSRDDQLTMGVTDYLYVGNGNKFNKITVDIGTAADVVSTLTAAYYNGATWQAVTITDTTKGTNKTFSQDGTITFTIPVSWEANTVNGNEAYWIRLDVGTALPTLFSINQITVSADDANAPKTYTDMINAYDGHVATDYDLTLAVADYLYVGNGTKFNKIYFDFGTVGTENGAATAAYWNGSAWTSVTITTDGTAVSTNTFHQDGTMVFTIPNDWEANAVNGTETYWIRLDVATALATVFSINEITVTRQNNITVGIPALATTGEWTTIMTDLSIPGNIPDASSIKSIGLQVAVDKGANVFHVRKLWLAQTTVDTVEETAFRMPGGKRINGLQAYAGNVDDPITNPWIFSTDAVFEMQTQNDDQIIQIPLEELGSLSSSENGLGHCVNGTYLYFNVGEKIERYFNRTLDDIGPDRDEGLPDDRPGIPKSLASYPGRVYAVIDAGTSGTSSVLALDGSAWHEVYRAPDTNLRIKSISVQAIPGTNVDRLWISMGPDILWLPISLNPYTEADYTFTHEGHLITSWIYANLLDVTKTWKSLKIFQEIDANRFIAVDYMVDVDTTWTYLSGFTTAPVQEKDIASPLPQSKRIKFRLRFISFDESITPRLKAIVTEGVAFVAVKPQYSWTFAIKKTTENIDLSGSWGDALTSLEQYEQLKTWANAGTQLTMEHHSTLYDGKTVFIEPLSVSPIKVVDNKDIENHVASLTCKEY